MKARTSTRCGRKRAHRPTHSIARANLWGETWSIARYGSVVFVSRLYFDPEKRRFTKTGCGQRKGKVDFNEKGALVFVLWNQGSATLAMIHDYMERLQPGSFKRGTHFYLTEHAYSTVTSVTACLPASGIKHTPFFARDICSFKNTHDRSPRQGSGQARGNADKSHCCVSSLSLSLSLFAGGFLARVGHGV